MCTSEVERNQTTSYWWYMHSPVSGTANAQTHAINCPNIYPWNSTVTLERCVDDEISFFVFRSEFRRNKSVIGVVKLLEFPSHGTCQMQREQLAYQTMTVMLDCPLWFQRGCGLTDFAHTLESQVNNGLFFLVQLFDFGKAGRKEEKKYARYEAMIYHRRLSPVLISVCRAGPWNPEWTEV